MDKIVLTDNSKSCANCGWLEYDWCAPGRMSRDKSEWICALYIKLPTLSNATYDYLRASDDDSALAESREFLD
jgi:hypothetical protein